MKIIVVGGVAAGASAAVRARRMNDSAEIKIFEAGPYVSFANCGLPYYVGGEIKKRENLLLVSPELFRGRFHIDVKLNHRVAAIDRKRKAITVEAGGERFEENYDKLILAPGCEPLIPPIKGARLGNVSTVFTIDDVDRIMEALDEGVKSAVVIGGGFIGLETAEGLNKRGISTVVAEMQNQLMTIFDPEFSIPMEKHLNAAGIGIRLGVKIREICGEEKVRSVELDSGEVLPADLVIVSAGIRPRTELAENAGLRIGITGGIVVDERMQTSDPDIFAAGDATESWHRVSGAKVRLALASNANRQGRVAGDNAAGGSLRYQGSVATSVIRLHDLTAARTGLSESEAKAAGIDCCRVYIPEADHASYYPGSSIMILKVIWEKKSGKILGAQAVGKQGVDKRIDVLATAIYAGLKVTDLENLDLAYSPPYSSAKGPEIMAGMAASNVFRGEERVVTPFELESFLKENDAEVIDIRTRGEWDAGHIPGARHIVMEELRKNPGLLDPGKKYVVCCGVGKRAHTTCRFLLQNGLDVRNLTGGWKAFNMDV
ncbi:MAG: FAD-dependent oxidoreductase [Lachnospiraceae bacterium]|nr:FAD-dependent oxidoreductase [Lachnospiraceae bacterium]